MTKLEATPLDQLIADFGEATAQRMLDTFTCARNRDIEDFVRHKAIEFSRQSIAKTQLVFTHGPTGAPTLAGIITLSTKIVKVREGVDVSRRTFKRILKFGTVTDDLLEISSPLLAQFAKNDAIPASLDIDGSALLDIALITVKEVHERVGGRTVYLECADEPSLIGFYEASGFNRIRTPAPNGLVRMIRYLAA